jgi:hypothetical protein
LMMKTLKLFRIMDLDKEFYDVFAFEDRVRI